jgi:hypothetical protein
MCLSNSDETVVRLNLDEMRRRALPCSREPGPVAANVVWIGDRAMIQCPMCQDATSIGEPLEILKSWNEKQEAGNGCASQ